VRVAISSGSRPAGRLFVVSARPTAVPRDNWKTLDLRYQDHIFEICLRRQQAIKRITMMRG